MKKFILRTIYISLPLLIGWAILEAMYRFVPNNYSAKHEGLKANKNAEVFILGNSHSFYGIHPEIMANNTYNASNISQGLLFDKLIFDEYIANRSKAKAIVLNADYTTFYEGSENSEFLWRRYFYTHFLHLDVPGISKLDPKRYSLALSPRFNLSFESIKLYLNNGTLQQCNAHGNGNNIGVNETINNVETAEMVVQKHSERKEVSAENISFMKDIIAAAGKQNIHVLIVSMPVTSHYISFTDKNKLKTIRNICHEAQQNENVTYIDLFNDPRFNNDDFHDPDHLNNEGAKKCTAIIDSTLTKILKG